MTRKLRRIKRKEGLSPIVTTVLLIALTIVITSVIFLWFRGMVQEGVTKFGKNIKLVCDDVVFDASYNSGILNVVNSGNVPIYSLNLKLTSPDGSYKTKEIKNFSAGGTWPSNGLGQGGTFSGDIKSSEIGNANQISITPVLIGTSSSGKKTFLCEGQYGQDIAL